MDAELQQLEDKLRKLQPAALPNDLLSRLDEAMQRWHQDLPAEQKIIPLNAPPAAEVKDQAARAITPWRWSAAAVAVLGVGVGLWTARPAAPLQAQQSQPTPAPTFNAPSTPTPLAAGLVPATYQTNTHPTALTNTGSSTRIHQTKDLGIVRLPSGQSARCLEITYTDETQYRTESGEILKVNQPHLKTLFVPLGTD